MITSTILYLSIILTVVLFVVSLFSHSYKFPLLLYLFTSPIVYAGWSLKIGNFSIIHLFNGGFIFIFILKFLLKKEQLYEFPYLKLFLFYFFLNLFVAINIYFNNGWFSALDFFIKSVFMPLSFYLFYQYYRNHSDGKRLIIILIVSGIFPLAFILVQKFSGHVWFYRETRGIVRNVGLYHDIVTPRIFLMQTLIGIFIYWHYFLRQKRKLSTIILISLLLLTGLGIYYLYSKAILITLFVWLLMFAILRGKKNAVPVVAIFALLIVIFFSGVIIESEIHQVFSKEVDFVSGNLSSDYVLSGRGGIWKMYLNNWNNLPFFRKIIGVGVSHAYFHNDYLRILFSGGIFQLSIYIIIIVIFTFRLLNNYIHQNFFLSFIALLCVSYLFIDSFGHVTSLYPHMQIFIWGLVGLSINENLEWKEEKALIKKQVF